MVLYQLRSRLRFSFRRVIQTNPMNMNDYEQLGHFMACHFDQDFDLDFSDPDEIVALYFNDDGGTKEFELALDQLHQLNELNYDEETLGVMLMKLGCFYQPRADG